MSSPCAYVKASCPLIGRESAEVADDLEIQNGAETIQRIFLDALAANAVPAVDDAATFTIN